VNCRLPMPNTICLLPDGNVPAVIWERISPTNRQVCDRLHGVSSDPGERNLPMKGEGFRDTFVAVHESPVGPSLPRQLSAVVAVIGGLAVAPAPQSARQFMPPSERGSPPRTVSRSPRCASSSTRPNGQSLPPRFSA